MTQPKRPVGINAVSAADVHRLENRVEKLQREKASRHPGIRFGWRENFSCGILLWLAVMLAFVAWEAVHETSRLYLAAWTAFGTFMIIAWTAMAFVHLKDHATDAN